MKYLLTGIILWCLTVAAQAQHIFKATIRSGDDKTPLPGATIIWKEQNKPAFADSTGLVIITGIPAGQQTFIITFIGYEPKTVTYTFPLADAATVDIELEKEEEDEEDGI